MEELGVRPDDDTVRRVSSAFANRGEFKNQKLVLRKYQNKWKYLRFNGERVRVRAAEEQ
ncbi:Pentatricopeptide repeat-containing protein [Platanthera guangdongensis]|uniref:Pentatricopeptide repeat-containing protein n=1 Tax=Platanthera guangdongensis TaxID=2320717 RepID=A0ABR2LNK0_9ASPA